MRSHRKWNNKFRENINFKTISVQSIRIVKGFGLIGIGLLRLIPSLLMEKSVFVTSLLYISRGMGTLGGLLGFFYQEYKNIGNLTLAEE